MNWIELNNKDVTSPKTNTTSLVTLPYYVATFS